jgi:hypothetical protein
MVNLRGALYRKIKERKIKQQIQQDDEEAINGVIGKEYIPSRKWEYLIVALPTDSKSKDADSWTKTLSQLGKKGWELVAVAPMFAQLGFIGSKPHVRCFFKREAK